MHAARSTHDPARQPVGGGGAGDGGGGGGKGKKAGCQAYWCKDEQHIYQLLLQRTLARPHTTLCDSLWGVGEGMGGGGGGRMSGKVVQG